MAPTPNPRWRTWFAAHPRYHRHFTPTGASWLNLVERFFAEITDKRIRRGTFRSVGELVRASLLEFALTKVNRSDVLVTEADLRCKVDNALKGGQCPLIIPEVVVSLPKRVV